MCGIVYHKSFVGRGVVADVLEQYEKQKIRGTRGFGFYLPETNRLSHNSRENRIKSLLKRNPETTEVLFHHRFPTSTDNVRNGCHPYTTKGMFENQYILVHNGVISNAAELRILHKDLGINYVSLQTDGRYNDSEALMYDLALYLDGVKDEVTAKGSIAFIMIERDKDGVATKLHFGRNERNPLKMVFTTDELTLSSQGAGEDVPENQWYTLDYATRELTYKPVTFPMVVYPPYVHQKSNRIGFSDPNYDRGHNKETDWLSSYQDGYTYDSVKKMWVPPPQDTEQEAWDNSMQLALDVINEVGTSSLAYASLFESMDSNTGKLARLSNRLKGVSYGSNKFKRLIEDRRKLWDKNDLLNDAMKRVSEIIEEEKDYPTWEAPGPKALEAINGKA